MDMRKHTAPLSPAPGPPGFAVAWCAAFTVLHVYWALGGNIGLAESAGAELAREKPTAFVLIGLWGVAALLVVGGVFWCAVARS
jgi:heme/copper-type cytochrome/quinol oxidase subunit 2